MLSGRIDNARHRLAIAYPHDVILQPLLTFQEPHHRLCACCFTRSITVLPQTASSPSSSSPSYPIFSPTLLAYSPSQPLTNRIIQLDEPIISPSAPLHPKPAHAEISRELGSVAEFATELLRHSVVLAPRSHGGLLPCCVIVSWSMVIADEGDEIQQEH